MKGLAVGVAGYTGASFIYSLVNKEGAAAAPKKEEHAPAVAKHVSVVAKEHATPAPVAAVQADAHSAPAPQATPVLQQLNQISDRLTKIEKALGV